MFETSGNAYYAARNEKVGGSIPLSGTIFFQASGLVFVNLVHTRFYWRAAISFLILWQQGECGAILFSAMPGTFSVQSKRIERSMAFMSLVSAPMEI